MTNGKSVFRVGISGSYGGLNLGDEAILQSMIAQLRASLPVEITVFSRNAADTQRRHNVEHVVPVRDLNRAEISPFVRDLDVFVLGGGGILFDAEAHIYLREAALARDLGVPFMAYAIGAGPLNDAKAQQLVRETLDKAAVVTVRERQAQQTLEHAGLHREIIVTADPALLLAPEPLPPNALELEGTKEGHRLVAMSVREPGVAAPDLDETVYHALLANACDYMVDRLDADLMFIPMEPKTLDMQHSHAVIAQMARAERATVLKKEYSSGQVLALLRHCALAVGMRLHFLIFAAVQRVPFVALPYAGKVEGFIESMGMPMPPIKRVNAGQLIAHIDRSWDLRADLQSRIDATLPGLQEKARETNGVLVRLLRERASHTLGGIP